MPSGLEKFQFENGELKILDASGCNEWQREQGKGQKNNAAVKSVIAKVPCTIPKGVFKDSKDLVKFESVGEKEVYIDDEAFKGCINLKDVNILGAKFIGSNAFEGCTSLKELYLPKVEKIAANAFKGCTRLKLTVGQELKNSNDIIDSGYEKVAQHIKELDKVKLKDENEKLTEYKSFKATCKNMCEKGVADYETAKSLLRTVFENVDEWLSKLSDLIGSYRGSEIRGKFDDFKGIITKFDTVSAKIGAAKNQQELRNVVDSVKAFQSELKSYVLEKYKYLKKAGYDSIDGIEKICFDKFFRVLLGIAGVKKEGSVSSNKTYSSFGLGGGGMDLLVRVKECELNRK